MADISNILVSSISQTLKQSKTCLQTADLIENFKDPYTDTELKTAFLVFEYEGPNLLGL